VFRQIEWVFCEVAVIGAPIAAAISLVFFGVTSGVGWQMANAPPPNYSWLGCGLAITGGIVGAWLCAMAVKKLPAEGPALPSSLLLRVPV
jgi:hypothetical protein